MRTNQSARVTAIVGAIVTGLTGLTGVAGCGDNRATVDVDAGAIDASAAVDAAPAHLRVLFIGNSYTSVNDLPGVVGTLGRDPLSPVEFDIEWHAPGGATWADHDGNPEVDTLIARGWDVVVLQDQSQQPWLVTAVPEALVSLDAKIHAAGAETVLYMTWARDTTPAQQFAQSTWVARYYDVNAAAIGARVAPVGRAWERALRDPQMHLHADDGSHPNARGTYLAACVMYATLTGVSPVGLGDGGLDLSDADRATLQAVTDTTLAARILPAPPLLGRWPLTGGTDGAGGIDGSDLVVSEELVLGDVTGPDTGSATQFGTGRYAAAPFFVGLTAPGMSLSFDVSRPDWSIRPPIAEYLFSLETTYRIHQTGLILIAEVYVDGWQPALTYDISGLAPGWHHMTFAYDRTSYTLAIDEVVVAAGNAPGRLGSTPPPRALIFGAPERLTYPAATPVEPTAEFSGSLANIELREAGPTR